MKSVLRVVVGLVGLLFVGCAIFLTDTQAKKIDERLAGWPDVVLSTILVVAGVVFIAIALFAPRSFKPVAAAYAVLP